MAEELPAPANRREQYLANIAGMPDVGIPEPKNREEQYLYNIALNGGGGGGNVKTYTDAELETLWEEA